MPSIKSSPFPLTARSQVWTTLIAWLQADNVLHQAVDTWQVWSGRESDTAVPTEEDLPLVRLTPAPGSQVWLDENTQQCNWPIKVEIGIEGTDLTHLLNFWGAIETALFTGNNLLNALIPFGVIQKTITTPSLAPKMFGEKSGLAGEGVLLLKMRIAS